MNDSSNNEKTVWSDVFLPLVLLVLSYGVLFLLPPDEKIISWIILAVSAFLFCLGFFWLGGVVSDLLSESIMTKLLILYGTVLLALGFIGVYREQGSIRSIIVATLFLIQGTMILGMSAGASENSRLSSIIFRTLTVALIIFAIFLVIREKAEHGSVETAFFMLLAGFLIWSMSGGNAYNTTNAQSKIVPGVKGTIKELVKEFEHAQTPLGPAWIGHVSEGKRECIIFGPTQDGVFVYGYYQFGHFYVAAINLEGWLDADEAEKHRIELSPEEQEAIADWTALPEIYKSLFASCAKAKNNGNLS